MVGTAVYHVGAYSSTHSRTELARKPGVQTTLPPTVSDDRRAPTNPWMWNNGMTLRHRSASVRPRVLATVFAERNKPASVNGTSFGSLVVPEVNKSRAASGPVAVACVEPGTHEGAPAIVQQPAAAPTSSSKTGTPTSAAASRA